MSGRRAALKVARKGALRNRKRTIFLVLLVAVPVALGVVVGGITRASNLTPAERVREAMGAADAAISAQGGPEVVDWVYEQLEEIDPGAQLTSVRRTRVWPEGAEPAVGWDLDLHAPLTEGMVVLVDGEPPDVAGEVAISPQMAETLDVEIGDLIDLGDPDLGQAQVVGWASDPTFHSSPLVLLWPGALHGIEPSTTVLLGSDQPDHVVSRLDELWQSEGEEAFWPDPAVVPKPPELEGLGDRVYALLTEAQIDQLVELAGSDPQAVTARAFDMTYGSGGGITAGVYVETRDQVFNQGGVEGDPGVMSTAVSAVVLIEVAFIAGAAFAAGTRRRLREIGLLGASGASREHIRTAVVGEGLTIGLIGSGLGAVFGLAVMLAGRPLVQGFVSKPITGLGVSVPDLVGPVIVAVVSVLVAAWIPARTAARIPTTTALQGRMPASPPRRWVVPAGVAIVGVGALLMAVAIASTSNFSGLVVGLGGALAVVGVAFLASPILAGVSRLADIVPALGRLVLRDSGRHRTRSSVAVAAILVILLAPAIFITMSETSREQQLIDGLPSPGNHLLVSGKYDEQTLGVVPIDDADVAAVSGVVPDEGVAVFHRLEVEARTADQIEIDARPQANRSTVRYGSWDTGAAVANDDLVALLGNERVGRAIDDGRIVVLGIEERETTVSVDFQEHRAVEIPVAVARGEMPRILLPPDLAVQYEDVGSRPLALFVLERPLTQEERLELSFLQSVGGFDPMEPETVYAIAAGVTLLAVLIVIALVTAVSAAEVDRDLETIVAVGATGAFRRRFLGVLTGYQTFVAALLAVPLGLGLMKVFTTASLAFYQGPFGELASSQMFIPWGWLAVLVVATPLVVGLLTAASVRSARVAPPRRAA